MTFATESEKEDSRRFSLVRLTPRKYLGLGTLISGNDYSFPAESDTVSAVLVNGVVSTFTQSSTGIVVTSTDDLEDSGNIVCAQFDLHLSSGPLVITTGSVYSLPDATWEPRLLKNPSVVKGMSNALNGIITINASNISIAAHDDYARRFLGEEYSFSNAPMVIWQCIGSEANNRLIFTGVVTGVSVANEVMTFTIADETSKLRQSASFGNFYNSRMYSGHPDRPYIKPENENAIAPITIGSTSAFTISPGYRHLDAFDTPNCQTYHCSDGVKCFKVSPQSPGPTDTVEFYAGRFLGTALKKINFGTISAAYRQFLTRSIPADTASGSQTVNISDHIVFLQTSAQECEIGDYIPELKGFVCAYGTNIYSTYDVAIHVPTYGESSADGAPPTDGTISVPSIANNTNPQMSVWIESGDNVSYTHAYEALALNPDMVFRQHGTRYLPFTTDLSNTYTHNGQTVTHLHFTVNPTTVGLVLNSGDSSTNHLLNGVVKCRFKTTSGIIHSDFLSFGCQSAGLTVNTTSFDAQGTLMAAEVACTWPYDGGQEFGTYLDFCQLLLKSTFGILKINESSQAEYQLVRTPLTIDETRTTTDLVNGETSCRVIFDDIVSEVRFEHKQIKSQGVGSLTTDAVYTNTKAKYLHAKDKTITVQHVLLGAGNTSDIIGGYMSSPTVEYTYTTTSKDLVTEVGDGVTLTNKSVAQVDQTADGLVLNVDSNASRTTIKINELRGVD